MPGQKDTPPYALRLLRQGTEVKLSGGMPAGTANALETMLDAAPQIKVVHLNSIGGFIGEGEKIRDLIEQRGLTTYTSTQCASACTIAYLGGTSRYLAPRAKLGLHLFQRLRYAGQGDGPTGSRQGSTPPCGSLALGWIQPSSAPTHCGARRWS